MHRGFGMIALVGIMGFGGVVGCGSDDSPTTAEYIALADPICADANARIEAAYEDFWDEYGDLAESQDPAVEDELFVAIDAVVRDGLSPVVEAMLVELRELERPEADDELLVALYDDLETAMTDAAALSAAAVDGGPEARAALDAEDPFADVDRRAREYGMTVCGAENE